jgi:mannitol/fructose-specific phosphotransferase system IIA component (Ntr-type)
MSYQRRITYRAGLFDPPSLNSLDKIADSLSQFEAVLNENNYVQALDDLLDNTRTVELVLSGMNDTPLNTWIVKHFPTTFESFLSSFEHKLLCRLSIFHCFHTSPDDVDYNVLRDHHRTVTRAQEALRALFAIALKEGHPLESSFKKGKAKSQKNLKMNHTPVHKYNTEPLTELNIAIPHTSPDAQASLTVFLGRLKDILEFYLNRILSSQIANSIKDGFIPHDEALTELMIITNADSLPIDCPDTPVPTVPTTENHPIFPEKSALFFDSPEGFGPWRILVSQAAHSNLREFHRSSKNLFNIITKKIREISNGHFSEDNQKRINGPSSTDVPVFEAKMTKNLRLVYIVDCDATGRQVLKLFGIMNHAHIKNRSWEDVGRALGKRGKEYRERCVVGPRRLSEMFHIGDIDASNGFAYPTPVASSGQLIQVLLPRTR